MTKQPTIEVCRAAAGLMEMGVVLHARGSASTFSYGRAVRHDDFEYETQNDAWRAIYAYWVKKGKPTMGFYTMSTNEVAPSVDLGNLLYCDTDSIVSETPK